MAKKKNKKISTSKSALDKVKNSVLKTPKNKSLDQVDGILDRVSDNILNKDAHNQSEMMRRLFSDNLNSDVFKNISSDIIFSYDLVSRLLRYNNAEEICDMIPYCSRALKVISNEIIAPDEITKESLQFLQEDSVKSETDRSFVNVRAINNILKIEDHIHTIVSETLKLGDQFVEICDYSAEDVPITQSLLNEGVKMENIPIMEETEVEFKEIIVNEFGKEIEESVKVTVIPSVVESVEKNENVDISKVRLIFHDPNYVIKLQSHRFKMCLGYLVLPRPSTSGYSSNASGCNTTRRNVMPMQNYGAMGQDFLGIDRIYKDIINLVKKHISGKEIAVDKKEAINMIGRAIKEFEEEERLQFKVRYVPPERMQHFMLESRRFFPYGESMFYKTSFSAKLLIAFQTALVIKRIADSSDKRAVYVETSLPRNVRSLIEEIKEGMRKRKFSIDSMGNIGSIACFDLNTKIRLTCGCSMPLRDIITLHNKGVELEVYSYDHSTGKIVPDKIANAQITGYNVDTVEVTLDNGISEICTPEHLWMLRDGTYKQAIELKPDDSLMPLYRRSTVHTTYKGLTYEELYHPGLNEWELTHRSFGKYWDIVEDGDGKIIHHDNKNPMDNSKQNILGITRSEHGKIHAMDMWDGKKRGEPGRSDLIIPARCDICYRTYNKDYRKHSNTCSPRCFEIFEKNEHGYNTWEVRKDEEQYKFVTVTCSNCGKEIQKTVATLRERGKRLLCCDDKICMKRTEDLNRLHVRNPEGCTKIEFRKCITCGKTFVTKTIDSYTACSIKCANDDIHQKRRDKISNRVLIKCDNCGKTALVSRRIVDRRKYNSCENKECRKIIHQFNWRYNQFNGKMQSDVEFGKCIICGKPVTFNERKKGYEYFTCGTKKCSIAAMQRGVIRNDCSPYLNHKVVSVNPLKDKYVVGDIQTEKYHNFGLESGAIVHNSLVTSYETYFLPQNKGKRYVEFDQLPTPLNIRDISDELKYFRDQLVSDLECLSLDTKIPLLNGATLTLQEIIDQYEKGVENMYVHSYDNNTGKIVPGKITWAGITRKNTKVIRVHLDNGEYVDSTIDHPFMMRDGKYRNAEDLKPGDLLKPLNTESICKIATVEHLEETVDTGDIRIEEHHNFATSAGVVVHNCPAVYLNQEENLSNRNALSFENIMFARTIVAYQSKLSKPVRDLFSKLYRMIHGEIMPSSINITFFPPRMLEIEKQAEHNETVTRLINALSELGVNKEYLKKKYLSIDWEAHDKFETNQKLDDKAKGGEGEGGEEGGGGKYGQY